MRTIISIAFLLLFINIAGFSQSVKVKIETDKGDMTIMLYDETPVHRDNFVKLVKEGFYEGLLFHRVISNFMIQAGDPNSKNAPAGKSLGTGGPGYTLPAEIVPKYFHKYGALAAARTADQGNPQRRSSGSQFYIVQGQKYTDMQLDNMEKQMNTVFSEEQRDAYNTVGGTPHLDAQYTVFGEVIEGLTVINKVVQVETDKANRPLDDIKIIKMSIVK